MRDKVNLLTVCRYPIRKVGKKSLVAAAEQAFDELIADYDKSRSAKAGAECRSAQAAAAARLAVQSPRHVSKRYQQPPQPPPKLPRQRQRGASGWLTATRRKP
jgi:hypothetical protein